MAGAMKSEEGKSRRDLLKVLGAAAAGAVASGMLKADEAQADHGTINAVSATDDPAIHGHNSSGGPGIAVEGTTTGSDGIGVLGRGYIGVQGEGGLAGVAATGTDYGLSAYGYTHGVISSSHEVGVQGSADSEYGVGIHGVALDKGENNTGVLGTAWRSGVAVKAKVTGGDGATALQVEGKAKFSTAAASTIPAGQDSASVSNSLVTAQSHVTVTLTGDPGQASSSPGTKPVVVWVERRPGTGFVVHLSRPVRFATPFTYLIVEPV
jgi:hypothetical protein